MSLCREETGEIIWALWSHDSRAQFLGCPHHSSSESPLFLSLSFWLTFFYSWDSSIQCWQLLSCWLSHPILHYRPEGPISVASPVELSSLFPPVSPLFTPLQPLWPLFCLGSYALSVPSAGTFFPLACSTTIFRSWLRCSFPSEIFLDPTPFEIPSTPTLLSLSHFHFFLHSSYQLLTYKVTYRCIMYIVHSQSPWFHEGRDLCFAH